MWEAVSCWGVQVPQVSYWVPSKCKLYTNKKIFHVFVIYIHTNYFNKEQSLDVLSNVVVKALFCFSTIYHSAADAVQRCVKQGCFSAVLTRHNEKIGTSLMLVQLLRS